MYTYVGLETKHARKLTQLVCKSQRAASSLAKSSEAASKQWVFYSAKSCRIWHAFKPQKFKSLVYWQRKDNKDEKKAPYGVQLWENTLCATYSDYFLFKTPIAYIASSNNLTYITHANNKLLKDAFAMCAI